MSAADERMEGCYWGYPGGCGGKLQCSSCNSFDRIRLAVLDEVERAIRDAHWPHTVSTANVFNLLARLRSPQQRKP